jgi:prepilin-type processing-associated H-X9-DG protein
MRKRNAFTLTELLVVLGCIAVLVSLLLPVAAKARSISRATTCLSNLRAISNAWTIYMQENRSALVPYNWNTAQAYSSYWFGILDQAGLRGDAIKCPAAYEPSLDNKRRGYGTAQIAWTGQFVTIGSALRLSKTQWRDGSYAYNRYLNAKNGFGPKGLATSLLSIKEPLSEVPTFMDCAFADVAPPPAVGNNPPSMPPDLTGNYASPTATPPPNTPGFKYGGDHWSLLIARHDKAINVAMADGSARLVPLADLYQLSWKSNWQKVELTLP